MRIVLFDTHMQSDFLQPSHPPEVPSAFLQLGLHPQVTATLPKRGIETPSPIQAAVIPLIAQGKDVIGCANTGSGKTAAYLLPLIDSRINFAQNQGAQVIILADTWDLIKQISEEARIFGHEKGLKCATLYGGHSAEAQAKEIQQGAHVVVGTIGRVLNFLRNGTLNSSHLSVLVIDEVDKLLKGGDSRNTVQQIERYCQPREQTVAFSATVDHRTIELLRTFMRSPEVIDVSEQVNSDRVRHVAYNVSSPYEKVQLLIALLRHEPIDKAIVFVRTNNDVVKLHRTLELNGFESARPFTKLIREREKNFSEFSRGDVSILVASGLAERGLDIPGITHIIHFDFPDDKAMYLQRSGRTNRMNYKHDSVVISLKTPRDDQRLLRHDKFGGFDVEFDRPRMLSLGKITESTDAGGKWRRA